MSYFVSTSPSKTRTFLTLCVRLLVSSLTWFHKIESLEAEGPLIRHPSLFQVLGSFWKLASEYEQVSSLKFNASAVLIVSSQVQKSSWATWAPITCQVPFCRSSWALSGIFKVTPSETPAWHPPLPSHRRISAFKKCIARDIFDLGSFKNNAIKRNKI